MIRETYKAKVPEKRGEFPEAEFVEITRSKEHVLSPTWDLYNLYKRNKNWEMYTRIFLKQMEAQACKDEMKRLWDLAQTKDVFLVCYEKDGENCHRHLVISLMKKMFGGTCGTSVVDGARVTGDDFERSEHRIGYELATKAHLQDIEIEEELELRRR